LALITHVGPSSTDIGIDRPSSTHIGIDQPCRPSSTDIGVHRPLSVFVDPELAFTTPVGTVRFRVRR